MKSSSHFHSTKRFRSRAIGTLMLVIPLCGITSHLPTAQAQPVLTPPVKKNPFPLTPEETTTVNKILAISGQEKVCKTLVDLKVENATLEDTIVRLKELLPTGSLAVEVRDIGPVRVSFDLKQTRVGDILNHVAALAGSKVFVRPNGLVISPLSSLSDLELQDIRQSLGGEWSQSTQAGGGGWSTMANASTLFTRAVAQEATKSNAAQLPTEVINTTFGNFSPESQALLGEMARWLNQGPSSRKLNLDSNSPVRVDTTNPKAIMISFAPGISEPSGQTLYIRDAH